MGKKVKEYQAGDFIFAKVKGYPAWPARVKAINGKKYYVYFYGTGETANLPSNQIFDYKENKEKFLSKTIKRKDFNEGVTQIEYEIANDIPLGTDDIAPTTLNESQLDSTVQEEGDKTTTTDTSQLNDTKDNETVDKSELASDKQAEGEKMDVDQPAAVPSQPSEVGVEDSDEGPLVIDEGKKETKKAKGRPKGSTKKPDEASTPKADSKRKEKSMSASTPVVEHVQENTEVVSRSGRKIRPKRFLDPTDDTPPPVKRAKPATPVQEKPVEESQSSDSNGTPLELNGVTLNAVSQVELENLKEPFSDAESEISGQKQNILIARLPNGNCVGIKLFQDRPLSYKDEAARLEWDIQAAKNAITLKKQLESGEVKPESIITQLEMELNLTEEERINIEKERENDDKRSRIQFLQVEMKLVELDAKIKSCLGVKKADALMCLQLLDQLAEVEVKPLMLLKHPGVMETVKRLRAYVGNTEEWHMSEEEAVNFNKQAHIIRTRAQELTTAYKALFEFPPSVSFWEAFAERVLHFKKCTQSLSAEQLLEIITEPPELNEPRAYTSDAAIDAANNGTIDTNNITGKTNEKRLKRQSSKKDDTTENGNNENLEAEVAASVRSSKRKSKS